MEVSDVRHVKSAKKSYCCDWCAETIDIGTPYATWFTYVENVTARVHPECYVAQCRVDKWDDEMPLAGTYRRGCWCGEKEKDCKCRAAQRAGGK